MKEKIMKIKLELSTGKKIILTGEEYEELKAFLYEHVNTPWYPEPYRLWPGYPAHTWWITNGEGAGCS